MMESHSHMVSDSYTFGVPYLCLVHSVEMVHISRCLKVYLRDSAVGCILTSVLRVRRGHARLDSRPPPQRELNPVVANRSSPG